MKIQKILLVKALVLFLFFPFQSAKTQVHTVLNSDSSQSAVLRISGEVTSPLTLTLSSLKSLPEHTVTVKDKTGSPHQYTGIYVTDVLAKAGVTTGHELRGENLSKYVLASCADGYQVVYSLAELDSSFVKNLPIIAYEIDGQPLM
ncbi:Oxidoreductase molybdopterin binding domain-containing protein [Arachidicoccus rhizosphaerae]|uniref:Oxidoreductase molybdopterin binding domain-containing protein n=1 Tax=Arachidicoccus rhizosphaerae TaxID=551991 RepID=A0A1H3WUH1_9BACT|nr:molybdopterin-dependent oxidoreductase [Arachidicoccus rhizosphaerae]SDZ90796.1 Oxidoreductase molybdopterin binding domain-containing protein [Arachidicoccus rhizosphaerae]